MNLEERFRLMPKIELHVHVEGAVPAATYYRLAEKNHIKLPVNSLEEWEQFFEFRDFAHFIQVYIAASRAIQKPADFTAIIEAFYRNQQEQNIIYTEAFLSASLMVEKFDTEEILDALAEGMKRGEANYHVKINFIPDIARQVPHTQDAVLDLVIRGKERGIFIGLGLGGLEQGFPPELFTDTYTKANAAGLRLLAHAGEGVGPESIWGAIRSLNAERIGHGIRCIDDPALVRYLAETKLPVEVSPTSNYCLKLVAPDAPHPIRQMVDGGLFCTVNSDDPAMFSTTLADEYLLLAKQGFTWEECWQLNENALTASFLSPEQKVEYRSVMQAFVR
jgi:adenosine deaminase